VNLFRPEGRQLRIASWNILHGGGKRVAPISEQLLEWKPDVVGLIEFRANAPSQSIAGSLRKIGLVHQTQTIDGESEFPNGLFIASRWRIEVGDTEVIPELGSWLHVEIGCVPCLSLALMSVPNRSPDGIKYRFHEEVVSQLRSGRIDFAMGDTNSGVPGVDEEAPYFNQREGQWFSDLESAGWQDVWRVRNPDAREFTWHSPNGGNGFRLDQFFANTESSEAVQNIRYDWGAPAVGKLRGPSDHAAMIVDLNLDYIDSCR
jgi:exodeoxyribonuclease III